MALCQPDAHPDTHWFNGAEVVRRPTLPRWDKLIIRADGIDKASIAAAPPDATVEVTREGVLLDVEDDGIPGLEFTTTSPGTYRVVVRAWPHMDYETEIVAT